MASRGKSRSRAPRQSAISQASRSSRGVSVALVGERAVKARVDIRPTGNDEPVQGGQHSRRPHNCRLCSAGPSGRRREQDGAPSCPADRAHVGVRQDGRDFVPSAITSPVDIGGETYQGRRRLPPVRGVRSHEPVPSR